MYFESKYNLGGITPAYEAVEKFFSNGYIVDAMEAATDLRATNGIECPEDAILTAALARATGNFFHAHAILRLASSRWFNHIGLQIAWINALSEDGQILKAFRLINKIYRISSSDHYQQIHACNALLHVRGGMADKAIDIINHFLPLTKQLRADCAISTAQTLLLLAKPQKSVVYSDLALDQCPNSPDAILTKCMGLVESNDQVACVNLINTTFSRSLRNASIEWFAANLWFSFSDYPSCLMLLQSYEDFWPTPTYIRTTDDSLKVIKNTTPPETQKKELNSKHLHLVCSRKNHIARNFLNLKKSAIALNKESLPLDLEQNPQSKNHRTKVISIDLGSRDPSVRKEEKIPIFEGRVFVNELLNFSAHTFDFPNEDLEKLKIALKKIKGQSFIQNCYGICEKSVKLFLDKDIPSVVFMYGKIVVLHGYDDYNRTFLTRSPGRHDQNFLSYDEIGSTLISTKSVGITLGLEVALRKVGSSASSYFTHPPKTLPYDTLEDQEDGFLTRDLSVSGPAHPSSHEPTNSIIMYDPEHSQLHPQTTTSAFQSRHKIAIRGNEFSRLLEILKQKETKSQWEQVLAITERLINMGLQNPALWLRRAYAFEQVGDLSKSGRCQDNAQYMRDHKIDAVLQKVRLRSALKTDLDKVAALKLLCVQFDQAAILREEVALVLSRGNKGKEYEAWEKSTLNLNPDMPAPKLRLENWYKKQSRQDLVSSTLVGDLTKPSTSDSAQIADQHFKKTIWTDPISNLISRFRNACLVAEPETPDSLRELKEKLEIILPENGEILPVSSLRIFILEIRGAQLPRYAKAKMSTWLEQKTLGKTLPVELSIDLAILDHNHGHNRQTLIRLESILREHPNSIRALLKLGEIQLSISRVSDAIATFCKVLDLEGGNDFAYQTLSKTYAETNEHRLLLELKQARAAATPYDTMLFFEICDLHAEIYGWHSSYMYCHAQRRDFPNARVLEKKIGILTSASQRQRAARILAIAHKKHPNNRYINIAEAKYRVIAGEARETVEFCDSISIKWNDSLEICEATAESLMSVDSVRCCDYLESLLKTGVTSTFLVRLYLEPIEDKIDAATHLLQILPGNYKLPVAEILITYLIDMTEHEDMTSFVSWVYSSLDHGADFKVFLIKTLFTGHHSDRDGIALNIANQLLPFDPDNIYYQGLHAKCLLHENPIHGIELMNKIYQKSQTVKDLESLCRLHMYAGHSDKGIIHAWRILKVRPDNTWAMTAIALIENESKRRLASFEQLLPFIHVALTQNKTGIHEPMFLLASVIVGSRTNTPLPFSWIDAAISHHRSLEIEGANRDELKDLQTAIYSWFIRQGRISEARPYKPTLWQKTTSEFISKKNWIPLRSTADMTSAITRPAQATAYPSTAPLDSVASLGIAEYRISMSQKAIQHLSLAILTAADNTNLYFYRGLSYLDKEKPKEALADLNKAIERGITNPKAYFARARSLAELGKTQEAIYSLDAAIGLSPESTTVICERGRLFIELGRFENAISDFDRALRIRSACPPALIGRCHAKIKIGDHRSAILDIRQFLKFEPNNIAALEFLAESLSYDGQSDAAKEIFQRLISIDSQNVGYLTALATIFIESHDDDSAIGVLQKALRLQPTNSRIQFKLGALLTQKSHGDLCEFYQGLALLKRADKSANQQNYGILAAIASAYFSHSLTSKAIETQNRAIALIDRLTHPEIWETYKKQEKLFTDSNQDENEILNEPALSPPTSIMLNHEKIPLADEGKSKQEQEINSLASSPKRAS